MPLEAVLGHASRLVRESEQWWSTCSYIIEWPSFQRMRARLLLAEVPYEGLMMSPRTLSHICGSKESRPAWTHHKLKSARDMFGSREGFGNPAKDNRSWYMKH